MEFIVDDASVRERLDQFLNHRLPDLSRARLQKLIKKGSCQIDCKTILDPSAKVFPGQKISLDLPAAETALVPEEGEIRIIWQNSRAIVCEKPAGLTVHPCPSQPGNTLIQKLLTRFPSLAAMEGLRPGVAHRLDKDTSGLIIVALDEAARLRLAEAFAQRRVRKEYLALVWGSPPDVGECSAPIGRHPVSKTKMAIVPERSGGRDARTEWKKLWSSPDGRASLLRVRIFTGRTHQIRVHLASMGYPILGDRVYAPENVKKMAPRQALHAHKISFEDPETGELVQLSCPPPDDFYKAALDPGKQKTRVVIVGAAGSGKSAFRKALAAKNVPATSADDIVGQLYSRRGHISDWLERNGASRCLNADGSINKANLFKWLRSSPGTQKIFETFVHNLVADEILSFWASHSESEVVAAEIPLFFESPSKERFHPVPYVVGVACDPRSRRERLEDDRGWSDDKISTIDSWQLPEKIKLAKCDYIVKNDGSLADLDRKADIFLEDIKAAADERQRNLAALLKKLCDDPR